jgi:hypothetical protein
MRTVSNAGSVVEIFDLPEASSLDGTSTENLIAAIRDGLALLHAISQGDLLAALPEDHGDRKRHETAVALLELLDRRFREAIANCDYPMSGGPLDRLSGGDDD